MNKLSKFFFIVYSLIFLLLIGFLVYINFFDSKIDFISNKNLVAVIFAFLLGIIKILARNNNTNNLNFYKNSYSYIIKDSFSDDKKDLKKLLKAAKLYNEDKFSKALCLLSDLETKCNTKNEKYSVYLFEALIYTDLEDNKKVIEIYEMMIDLGIADSRIYSNLLKKYEEEGYSKKAYEAGMLAIQADPKNSTAYNNFAYFLFSEGDYKKAEEYAKEALEIKSNLVEAITLLYIISKIEGKNEDAEIYERKAISNGRSKKELNEILEYYIGENKS